MVREAVLQSNLVTLPEAFAIAVQHHQAGRLAEAEAIYRQILASDPRHADAMHLLGLLAHQAGRNDVAVETILKAIALVPTAPAFYSSLGQTYRKLCRYDEAIAAYRRAIQLKPDLPEAHSNLGNALSDQGHLDEAVAAYRRALELRPDFPDAHNNLGKALKDRGQLDEAIAACRRALQLKPDFAEAHNNLGTALTDQGRLDEALSAFQRAIQIKPDFAEAHNNLGNALMGRGQLDEAVAAYRHAIQIKPDFAAAHSNLLLVLHHLCDSDVDVLFREHRDWDEAHARSLAMRIAPHDNDRNPDRRLRIGCVSPDFREHSVAFFLEGLLAAHDRTQIEMFCYADLVHEDPVTARLRKYAGQWRTIKGRQDKQVADLIHKDGIDILVDLTSHTAHNRLLVFARKPAPVQVTWLGYPGTTGMSAMDYRLTDVHADPRGTTEHLHTEQLVRLPDCAWCFRPSDQSPSVSPPPVVRSGHVTFGCFNARAKITDEVLALWSGVLAEVPGSRLLLKNLGFREASVQQQTRALLAKAGLAPDRVELVGWKSTLAEHLAFYNRVDIALDTFPYHGTTTTCEALWQGVPVVTLAGRTHAARVGVSLLTNVGLPELIAANADDYIRIAMHLAADTMRLAELRSTMRERMAASPLMDAPRFARNVEHAYREMWRAWCMKPCSNPTS